MIIVFISRMKTDIKMSDEFYRVKEVCLEMFETRKYTLDEVGENDEVGWYVFGKTESEKAVHLYLLKHRKLNVELIKFYYTLLHQHKIKHAILVYHQNVTSSVLKLIQTVDIKIELFCTDELQYNLLKHKWVPIHEKISSVKKNEMKYPVIKKTDPVVRFMGFKSGDVLRIRRNNGSLYYRVVK